MARDPREELALTQWRAPYFFHRRKGRPGDQALRLAKVSFEQAGPGSRRREAVFGAATRTPANAEPAAPLPADQATAEADLIFFDQDPSKAFQQAWSSDVVRRAVALFREECEREGQAALAETLHRAFDWGAPPGEAGRPERRARRRFRQVVRAVVADTIGKDEDAQAELVALGALLPTGESACGRCGQSLAAEAVEQVFGGVCPRCLLQIGIDPEPPLEQVGPYEIVARLGADAQGETFRARQGGVGRDVLLRLLAGREDVEKARHAMRLQHPAAVAVYDAGVADGHPYMVSELIEGPTLEDLLGGRGVAPVQGEAVAQTLDELVKRAHKLGLVHGALEAAAVLVDPSGQPHVAGFGFGADVPEARQADIAAAKAVGQRCRGGAAPRETTTKAKPPSVKVAAPAAPPAVRLDVEVAEREAPGAKKTVLLLCLLGAAAGISISAVAVGFALGRKKDGGVATGPSPPDPYLVALEALASARSRLVHEGPVAEVFRAADDFSAGYPADPHGHWLAARAELARLGFAAAEERARQATRLAPGASPAWAAIGRVLMERPRPLEAIEPLEKGLRPAEGWRLTPHAQDEADLLLVEGLAALAKGEREKALKLFHRSNERRTSPEACRWSGVAFGDPHENVRWQSLALDQKPDYWPALFERGLARLEIGRPEMALADFESALHFAPGHAGALLQRGLSWQQLGKVDAAILSYTAALSTDAELAAAWLHRGIARAAQGRLHEAAADLSQAAKLEPGEWRVWLERMQVRRRLNDLKGALEDADRLVELAPTLAIAHLERGALRWKLGRKAEAEVDFQKAIRFDPRMRAEAERIKNEP